MSDLLVRNIDAKLKRRIAAEARAKGRSMSEEVKAALKEKFEQPGPGNMKMGTWMFSLVPEEYRGDDLVFEVPDYPVAPPDFE